VLLNFLAVLSIGSQYEGHKNTAKDFQSSSRGLPSFFLDLGSGNNGFILFQN
jgi:hypothetical protein